MCKESEGTARSKEMSLSKGRVKGGHMVGICIVKALCMIYLYIYVCIFFKYVVYIELYIYAYILYIYSLYL